MNQAVSSVVCAVLVCLTANLSAQESAKVDFAKDIKPILDKRCSRCHTNPDPKDDIYLESAADVIDSYVFAGDPEGSDFFQRMVSEDPDFMMPPPDDGGPMPREEALLVRLWIAEGAEWPEDVKLERPAAEDVPQEPGELVLHVNFERDVKPILEAHCLECHGQDNPADGVDFSTRAKVLGNYVLPHEPLSSSLFTRIISEDAGKVMPPPAEGDPLTEAEKFVIRLWINEGANWPNEIALGEVSEPVVADQSMAAKVWTFQGYFHPATVHFPVALISISALFVILHWLFGGGFRDAAFYCLIFGALFSVVASVMGWSLSPTTGYGDAPFDSSSASFWHRWSGVTVSVLGVIIAIMAIRARKAERARRMERARQDMPWQFGVLLLAVLVGLTGHQGGELTYGDDWYHRAFAMFDLNPNEGDATPAAETSSQEDADAGSASDSSQTGAANEDTKSSNAGEAEETSPGAGNGDADSTGGASDDPDPGKDVNESSTSDSDSSDAEDGV